MKLEQVPIYFRDLLHLWLDKDINVLNLIFNNKVIKKYEVSTATNGFGEEKNSYKTPRGWHYIRAKIGRGLPINSVFVARRETGEVYPYNLKNNNSKNLSERDWILTRILWLSGLEIGKNRLGNVDSMQRFIYIHGTPDIEMIGLNNSKGCIRMRNKDIIELFDQIDKLDYEIKLYIGSNLTKAYELYENEARKKICI